MLKKSFIFFIHLFFIFTFLSLNLNRSQAKMGNYKSNDPSRSNPNISLNLLLLGQTGNKGSDPEAENPKGFRLQEGEIRMSSNIDAYFRGDAILAVERKHKHAGHEEEGHELGASEEHEEEHEEEEEKGFIFEPEEIFIETLFIPHVTLKFGKFFAQLGRHNNLHTHYFPFVDNLLTNEIILGEEGLNDVGLSASVLVPTPWYFEIDGQIFSSKNEHLFNSDDRGNLAGVFFVKNLVDLSDSSTLELDLAFGTGKNSFDRSTDLYNVSLTYKWRPVVKSVYRSFSWTAEFLQSYTRKKEAQNERLGGISSWIQLQFAKKWWVQFRKEYLGLPKSEEGSTNKHSFLVGFFPTEYSGIRLQYDHINEPGDEKIEHRVTLQLNMSLGVHPAHKY